MILHAVILQIRDVMIPFFLRYQHDKKYIVHIIIISIIILI